MRCCMLVPAFLAGCLVLSLGLPAHGDDHLVTYSDKGTPINGTVESVRRDEVNFTTTKGQNSRTVSVNDIISLRFGGEPIEMQSARAAAAQTDYAKALGLLDRVHLGAGVNALLETELEYLKLFYAAKLAIAGRSRTDDRLPPDDRAAAAKQAGEGLVKFLSAQNNTHHYYEANEALGDLLVSIGNYDAAQSFYAKLTAAPWPDFRARADLLRGRALQQAGKFDQALAAYDAVANAKADGQLGQEETTEATFARTYCLAATGKAQRAMDDLNKIINNPEEDDKKYLARAYNARGNCYRALKESKLALYDYLHVHLLYESVPEADAEALANLVPLWIELKNPTRSGEAGRLLHAHHPFSPWGQRAQK